MLFNQQTERDIEVNDKINLPLSTGYRDVRKQ